MYFVKKKWTTAKSCNYKGSQYDSSFEMQHAMFLDSELKDGRIKSWEKQVKIPLIVNNYLICNYYIDFIVYHNDGVKEYVETKGWATDVWKMKWKLFEALFSDLPDVKLTIIQQGKMSFRHAKKLKLNKKI